MDSFICITTGKKANETINCHKADEVGLELLKFTHNKKFGELEVLKKTNIVKNSQRMFSVKVGKIEVKINSTFIFQIIPAIKQSVADLMKSLWKSDFYLHHWSYWCTRWSIFSPNWWRVFITQETLTQRPNFFWNF